MNKTVFLSELQTRLAGLPKEDIEERLSFYREMIDDCIEDGLSEESAVAKIGPVDQVVNQIMADMPLSRLVKGKMASRRSLKTGEILLQVLGSPLWIALLAAAVAVWLSVSAVLWSLVLAAYAAVLALAGGAVWCLVQLMVFLKQGNLAGAGCAAGAGLVCLGLAVLAYDACRWITRSMVKLTKSILLWVKSMFIQKEAE